MLPLPVWLQPLPDSVSVPEKELPSDASVATIVAVQPLELSEVTSMLAPLIVPVTVSAVPSSARAIPVMFWPFCTSIANVPPLVIQEPVKFIPGEAGGFKIRETHP